MIVDYKLKNFRVFGDNDDIIDIAPITILTGCNNSGKSSIVKSLCLLNDFCKQLKEDLDEGKKLKLENYKWDFRKFPFNQMGSFKNIVHKAKDGDKSTSAKEGIVTMELVVRSQILMDDVKMKLNFCSEEEDDLNNGYLQSYSIETLDGETIFKTSKYGGYSMNFDIVKDRIIYFLNCQELAWKYQVQASDVANVSFSIGLEPNEDELEKTWNNLVSNLKELETKFGIRALWEVLEWQCFNDKHINDNNIIGSSARSAFGIEDRDSELTMGSELGVFCFYPVLNILKNVPKNQMKEFILDKLNDKIEVIGNFDMDAIMSFLDCFEKSECQTIHELLNKEERKLLIQDESSLEYSAYCNPSISLMLPVSGGNMSVFSIELCFFVLDLLNRYLIVNGKSYNDYDEIDNFVYYKYLYCIDKIICSIIDNVWMQLIPGEIYYTGTNSVEAKRLYSLEDNSDFVVTLKDYLKNKRNLRQRPSSISLYKSVVQDYEPGSFLNKWMLEFGLAHHVSIDVHADGYGAIVRLYEDGNDKEGLLLADKGYGVTQLFAILLKIENAIIQSTLNAMNHRYNLVGFEQVKEGLRSYTYLYPITVALEEPENHLHPSMQSKFAEMIVDAYKTYGVHFMIESHSEYIIRKLQTIFAEGKLTDPDIRLLYVNDLKNSDKNAHQVYRIGINEDGSLDNIFGKGFLDEADSLVSDLFNIKMRNNAKA